MSKQKAAPSPTARFVPIGSAIYERWPRVWPPPRLSAYLKTLPSNIRDETWRILTGQPGPWWPNGIERTSLPNTLAINQALSDNYPALRAASITWRKRDKQFLSVMNRVRALQFSKPEKKAAVLQMLESECVIHRLRKEGRIGRGLPKPIPARAPRDPGLPDRSPLRWLRPQAVALVDALRKHGIVDSDRNAFALAAKIFALASGARITSAMVKDRVWRARGNK